MSNTLDWPDGYWTMLIGIVQSVIIDCWSLTKELSELIDRAVNDRTIAKSMEEFFKIKYLVVPTFYTLPKVLKSIEEPPGRPIISGINSPIPNPKCEHICGLFFETTC